MAERRPPRREGRPTSPGPRGKKFPSRPRPGDAPRPHRREADGSHPAGGPRPDSGPRSRRPTGPGRPADRRPGGPGRPADRKPAGQDPFFYRRPADADKAPARRPTSESQAPRPPANPIEEPERLQKVLAHAGIGSRRASEDYITQGRVTINGQIVRELGTKVVPGRDKVAVDGQPIHDERPAYIAVNKPKGYVSTNNDPSGRPRVVDLIPDIPQRVYTVGRLDEMSTGLMLLTNDGELANKLAHPKFGVEKVYRAVVAGSPAPEVFQKLTEGVWLAEGKVRAKRVKPIAHKGDSTVMEMVLAEGKNREVRRMMAKLGHKVMTLTRVAVGPITLKGLKPGGWRFLSAYEVDLLRKVAAGIPVSTGRYGHERTARAPMRGARSNQGAGTPRRPTTGQDDQAPRYPRAVQGSLPPGRVPSKGPRPAQRAPVQGEPPMRAARPGYDGPPSRGPRPAQGGYPQQDRRPSYGRRQDGPGPDGPRAGQGRPPQYDRRPGSDQRPGPRPPQFHDEGQSRPPAPGGQRRPMPPRPGGPSSYRPAQHGPTPRPAQRPPRDVPPTRRIIGMEPPRPESGPEPRRPMPRRKPTGPPRSMRDRGPLPPRKRRPEGGQGE